ncbi:MAG: hypothetical protein EPO27_05670 [Betaproteobacteria bacterium]|nr:MAG: hypothetical protein EPO27_05670 [Betaproteobacteria bacterium]
MTTLALAIASLLGLTGIAWLASRMSRLPICPVCVGVAGTWAGLLAARFAGFPMDATVLAILLGVSVLGVVQWRAERLTQGGSALLWKALAVPTGSAAAYGLVAELWSLALLSALAFALLALLFRVPRQMPEADSAAVSQLEERMKRCC